MKYPASIKNISARQFIRALERDGFVLARRSGATHVYVHEDGRRVVVHYHGPAQLFPLGTLRGMLGDAKSTLEDLKRLKLI